MSVKLLSRLEDSMSKYRSRLRKSTFACSLISALVLSGCQVPATVTPVPEATSAPTETPIATLATTETATTTPTNTASPTATAKPTVVISDEKPFTIGMPIFYVSGGDLWCSDLEGENALQLTEDDALDLVAPPPASGVNTTLSSICKPSVSPDGLWVSYHPRTEFGSTMVLIPTVKGVSTRRIDNTCYGVWSPDSTRLAYTPHMDIESVIYVYDVYTHNRISYYPPDNENTWYFANPLLWAPDGQALFFRGTTEPLNTEDTEIDYNIHNVIRLDIQTGISQVVGTVRTSIASSQTFCLDSKGNFTTDIENGAICSKDRNYPISPNGLWIYQVSSEAQNTTISMMDVERNVIWERELDFGTSQSRVHWSLDGEYLLIDDYSMTTPIWRLASDGSSELEQVVDEGYLLDVVSSWTE